MCRPKDRNINHWQRINAGDYVQNLLDELSIERRIVTLNTPDIIMAVAALFEAKGQKLSFKASNLGTGYIAYFICNRCSNRVKFLYYQANEERLCRKCLRLRYIQTDRIKRRFSKLLNKPYLSSEHKYILIKFGGITTKDVEDSGLNKSA